MKIIPKFADGGSFSSLLADYLPSQYKSGSSSSTKTTSSSKSSSSSDDDDKGKLTEKDLFNMIKGIDALPTDIVAITNSLTALMKRDNIIGSSSQDLNVMYMRALQQIKLAQYSKEFYDKTVAKSISENKMETPAIDGTGRLLVADMSDPENPELARVDMEEFLKNREKYKLQTVSNIYNLVSTNMTYGSPSVRTELMGVASSAKSFDNVSQEIANRVGTLGTDTIIREGYSVKDAEDIKQGAELVISDNEKAAIGAPGQFHISKTNKNSQRQIEKALNYIYASLSPNSRTLLQLQGVQAFGDKYGPDAAAKYMIQELLVSRSNFEDSTKLNWEGIGKSGNTIANEAKENKTKEDVLNTLKLKGQAVQIIDGIGHDDTITLATSGDRMGMVLHGQSHHILDVDGKKSLGTSLVSDVLRSEAAKAFDTDNISVAGIPIDKNSANLLITDGNCFVTEMPYKYADDNTIIPDLELKDKVEKVLEVCEKHGIKDPAKINAVLEHENLPAKYDENGNINADNYMRFAIFRVEGTGRSFDNPELLEDNKFIQLMDDDEKTQQGIVTKIKSLNNLSKNDPDPFDHFDYNDKWLFEGSYEHAFKGNLFMPILNELSSSAIGASDLTTGDMQLLNQSDKQEATRQQIKRAGGFSNGN
jgi:hypothetical protein